MHAAEGSLVPFDLISDLVVRLLDLCDGSGPAAQRYVGKVGVDHAVLDSNLVSHLEARGARLVLGVAHGSFLGEIVRPVAGDEGMSPFRAASSWISLGRCRASTIRPLTWIIAARPSHLKFFNSRFTGSTENFSGSNLPPIHSFMSRWSGCFGSAITFRKSA